MSVPVSYLHAEWILLQRKPDAVFFDEYNSRAVDTAAALIVQRALLTLWELPGPSIFRAHVPSALYGAADARLRFAGFIPIGVTPVSRIYRNAQRWVHVGAHTHVKHGDPVGALAFGVAEDGVLDVPDWSNALRLYLDPNSPVYVAAKAKAFKPLLINTRTVSE